MHKHSYSLEVLIKGRPAQEFFKNDRSFVEAREGTEYTLRFKNNGSKRVLAIFSVDGIEVLKGKAAAQADNGYVVDAFSSIEVKGYRIDETSVANFKFSGGAKSYSVVVGAETVSPTTGEVTQDKSDRNNGIIGVRVFEEDTADKNYGETYKKRPELPVTIYASGGMVAVANGGCGSSVGNGLSLSGNLWSTGAMLPASFNMNSLSGGLSLRGHTSARIVYSNSSTYMGPTAQNSMCGGEYTLPRQDINQFGKLERIQDLVCEGPIQGLAPDFDLGTQWGSKVADKVREVKFKKVAAHTDVEIYYASRQSLETWGIDFSNVKQIFSWPSAFEDKKRYCKVPPGYDVNPPEKLVNVWSQSDALKGNV